MKTKDYKGITLIALIITIIVLLILAAVSISLVVGDNGVLGQAVNATVATDIADTKEQIELEIIGRLDENGDYTVSTVLEVAKEITGNDVDTENKTVDSAKGNTVDISDILDGAKVSWWYTTNEDGELAVTNGTDVVTVGDRIYYEAESGKTYTSYATVNGYADQEFSTDSYTYGWRVLGADEETGELLITTLDLIGPDSGGYDDTGTSGRTYFYMGYQEGYNNCEDELDAICAIYGTGYGATGGRSITVEDVNKLTGYDPTDIDGEGTPYGSGYVYQYGNEVTYYWDDDGDYYPSYKSDVASGEMTNSHYQTSYKYGPGFVYFDVGSKSWKTSTDYTTEQDIVTLTSDYYYYSGSSYLTTTDTLYELLFYNNSDGASNSYAGKTDCFYYWLGSLFVYCYPDFASWGCQDVSFGGVSCFGFSTSYGRSSADCKSIRCVVSLEADVSLSGSSSDGWTIN